MDTSLYWRRPCKENYLGCNALKKAIAEHVFGKDGSLYCEWENLTRHDVAWLRGVRDGFIAVGIPTHDIEILIEVLADQEDQIEVSIHG